MHACELDCANPPRMNLLTTNSSPHLTLTIVHLSPGCEGNQSNCNIPPSSKHYG